MRVRELMKMSPKYCHTNTDLAAVAAMLWSGGCGALPVTGADNKVVGIITDRDICVALGTRNKRPSELTAGQVMSSNVAMCRSSDDIHAALKVMRTRQMRRMPVVGEEGKLEGILCLSDLILYARHDDGSRPDLSYEDVMGVLKSIYFRDSLVDLTA